MQGLPVEKRRSGWTYTIGLALWLLLFSSLAAIVVERDIRDAHVALTRYAVAYADHLDRSIVSNETVLKGFAALFGAIDHTDPEIASRYVQQVIATNPQIFALEIVQVVARDRLAEFVARKRRSGSPTFEVKSFSFDSNRKWQPVQDAPFYYPIVFMEPKSPKSEKVLGLDVGSVPFLRRPLAESLRRQAPVSSHPFKLVEGNLGYVVFFPIVQIRRSHRSGPAMVNCGELLVDMVIDAAKLTDAIRFMVFDGTAVLVYHHDFRPDDPKGHLLEIAGKSRSRIETALFPSFAYSKSLATLGEPFSLIVKRQVGWSDLHLGLLALFALLTLASSLILVAYLQTQQRNRILQIENRERLWYLANHDALTGLPNRMLLMDRLEQLLSKMLRHGKHLALLFLDIDDFKQVNDTYGHEVGDRLLKFVAERMRAAVRTEDTVARMAGDEFIILIEDVEAPEVLDIVSQNIQEKVFDGLLIEGKPIHVRISIGVALFPEDGDNPEALIKLADMKMYDDKARHHVGGTGR